jgi:TPR repeat protein
MAAPLSRPSRPSLRSALPAILGAVLASLFSVLIAIGFLRWRADAQRRAISEHQRRCEAGDGAACDLLRSACMKRSPEGCVALGDVCLGPGPRHDPAEGARLISEACEYHFVEACRRAASLYDGIGEVAPDPDRARALRKRACSFGDESACTNGP